MASRTVHCRRLAAFLALIVAVAACNFPTARFRRLTLEDVMATMDAVTPVATATLPATATLSPAATPIRIARPFPAVDRPGAPFAYTTRSGDTLEALAPRFEVVPAQIASGGSLPSSGYLPIGQQLQIPNALEAISPGGDVLPDGELVYSPAASDFDLVAFVDSAGGYLSRYNEAMGDGTVLRG